MSEHCLLSPTLTFNPSRAPASLGIAALLLLRVIRPIRWSPSLDGCQVTGCYNRRQQGIHTDTRKTSLILQTCKINQRKTKTSSWWRHINAVLYHNFIIILIWLFWKSVKCFPSAWILTVTSSWYLCCVSRLYECPCCGSACKSLSLE